MHARRWRRAGLRRIPGFDVVRAQLGSQGVEDPLLIRLARPSPLADALVLVFAFSLSWVWTTLALVVRTPASLSGLSFIVQFPLMFASNVFVDPSTMPGWLRAFVTVNPVSLLVTTVRDLMHGTATAGGVGWVLLASAALVAVFAPLTMHLYRTRT
jgi:ABC-2 type transport system permease protein